MKRHATQAAARTKARFRRSAVLAIRRKTAARREEHRPGRLKPGTSGEITRDGRLVVMSPADRRSSRPLLATHGGMDWFS